MWYDGARRRVCHLLLGAFRAKFGTAIVSIVGNGRRRFVMRTCRYLCFVSWLLVGTISSNNAIGEDQSAPRIATFRCDITPRHTFKIYDHEVNTIEHALLAKGIVIDAGNRYVLCALDWRSLSGDQNRLFRGKLAEAVGTTPSHVAVQCVHQHTAPSGREAGEQFLGDVAGQLAAVAEDAVTQLQPFDQIGIGQAKVERVASTRRIPTEGGKVTTRFTSTKGKPELRELPEGYIDPFLKTITFASGSKPLVRLHYYATHPQSFYLDGRVSIDFPGMARERLEEEEGVFQIYFTGCGGDIGAGKYNDGSRRARSELADRMFAAMQAGAKSTRLVPTEQIKWRTTILTLPAKSGPDKDLIGPIELCSLQIGPVHVLHLPGEPMVHFQLYAQELMPDEFVAVAGYGDGSPGYICTEKAFDEGGYEPRASRVAPQSEALVKKAIRQLLGLQ
jgi:hypothetical protein